MERVFYVIYLGTLFDLIHKTNNPFMKKLQFLLVAILLQSCFPVSIPPNLENGKWMEAKKFKRKLPNQYAYIFTDPKDANEFYYYVSAKFPPNQEGDSENNVPVQIDNTNYYISFYETEKKSRVVNLLPAITNEVLNNKNIPIQLDEPPITREGTWYIVLTITDANFTDALSPNYKNQKKILEYTKMLHNEYISTTNYNSLQFQK